jgi:hypothetical protein
MVKKELKKACPIEELILRGHARLLFGSHETSPIQTLPWWLGEGGVKTTEN